MKYGSTKTVTPFGDNDVIDLNLIHNEDVIASYRQHKERTIVHGQKEETTVYLQFASDMKAKRDAGRLAIVKDDPSTVPCFTIKYPHKDIDGSYMVITSWTERV